MRETGLTGKAFEKLFREYFRSLTVYAMQFVKDLDTAEDIVQELFLKLFEKKESLLQENLTSNYLYKSVYNRCLNKLDHQKLRIEKNPGIQDSMNSKPVDPLEIVEYIEFENKFLQALEFLSPQCRKIFEMSRVDGKKNQEIANDLKLSKRTVETHISQALKIMRKKLIKYLPVFVLFFNTIFFSTCKLICSCYQ